METLRDFWQEARKIVEKRSMKIKKKEWFLAGLSSLLSAIASTVLVITIVENKVIDGTFVLAIYATTALLVVVLSLLVFFMLELIRFFGIFLEFLGLIWKKKKI